MAQRVARARLSCVRQLGCAHWATLGYAVRNGQGSGSGGRACTQSTHSAEAEAATVSAQKSTLTKRENGLDTIMDVIFDELTGWTFRVHSTQLGHESASTPTNVPSAYIARKMFWSTRSMEEVPLVVWSRQSKRPSVAHANRKMEMIERSRGAVAHANSREGLMS